MIALAGGCGPAVGMTPSDTTSTTGSTTEAATTDAASLSTTTMGSTSIATTTDGSATLDESSSSTDPARPFIIDPDGGDSAIECDFWKNDCPRGEKCMPWANDRGISWNAWRCFPLDPDPAQVGDACTVEGNGVSGIDDCEQRSMCWNVDPKTNVGECVGFCTGTEANPTCPPGFNCVITSGPLILCLSNCDPLLQDCDIGAGCYADDGSFECYVDQSGDFGAAGDACMQSNTCDLGNLCADAALVPDCADDSCCTPFCDTSEVDAGISCDATLPGTECVPFYERGQAPPGYENVGFCAAP